MEKKQFNQLMSRLESIDGKLNLIVRFIKTSIPKPTVSGEENKILSLCNQKNTLDEMVKKTGKSKNNVNVTLTRLRNKGLIESEKVKGKLVYKRIR